MNAMNYIISPTYIHINNMIMKIDNPIIDFMREDHR